MTIETAERKKQISIVIPIFNEGPCIGPLWDRLCKLERLISGYQFEFIFVNDGSSDNSWHLLSRLSGQSDAVKCINFSRNFGHQIAITAGMDFASGDAVVVIDGDLQDPPELIEQMVSKFEDGYDVVYAVRRSRKGESFFKRKSSRFFYRFINQLSNVPIPLNTGDFRLMSRRVLVTLAQMPERNRFVRGMVSWVGYRQIGIPFDRDGRHIGSTKYPIRKMIKFALDGIFSFSNLPLKWATWLGFFSSLISLAYILVVIGKKFMGYTLPGYASVMVAILFLGGIQLITVGILGEYIGRIFSEQQKRPLYVLQDTINIEKVTST